MSRTHTQETKNRATELYFKIEKHFALGGEALSLTSLRKMLDRKSNSTVEVYIDILTEWKLIKRLPRKAWTITLTKTNYPPVEWRKNMKVSSKHAED